MLVGSSVLTVSFSFWKLPVSVYQQVIILLLIISLGIFSKFTPNNLKLNNSRVVRVWIDYIILFTSSLGVQLLVISSGGFYSPFLVLFHFYFLGLSLLVSLTTAISFLIFGLAALGLDIFINSEHAKLFYADIGTALLYLTSFIVIVPLAHFIASKYHLKDELSKVLSGQVKLGQSILESLSEIVVVTDRNLNVLSVNEALKKILGKTDGELVNKSFFGVLVLKDPMGLPATVQTLSIDSVINEKTIRVINDLLLYVPERTIPYRVSIQVAPIANSNGQVEKITFVVNQSASIKREGELTHPDLDKAQRNEEDRFRKLKEQLELLRQPKLSAEIDLLKRVEDDIKIARQLEDYPIQSSANLVDLALLCREVISSRQDMARSMGVGLAVNLPIDALAKEASLMSLSNSAVNGQLLVSDFAVPVDAKWLEILIGRLVDLALLLSIGQGSEIKLALTKDNSTAIMAVLSFSALVSNVNLEQALFEKYYPSLQQLANLQLGSGLEGYIVKTISTELNIPIEIRFHQNSPVVELSLKVTRAAR